PAHVPAQAVLPANGGVARSADPGRGEFTASSIRVCRSEAAGGRSEGPGTATFQFLGTAVDGPEQAAPAAYARRAASDHTRIEDAVSASASSSANQLRP